MLWSKILHPLIFLIFSTHLQYTLCENESTHVNLDIDISQLHDAKSLEEQWHDDVHIQFVGPRNDILCDHKLSEVRNHKIACDVEKKYLARGENSIHAKVYLQHSGEVLEHFDLAFNIDNLTGGGMTLMTPTAFFLVGGGIACIYGGNYYYQNYYLPQQSKLNLGKKPSLMKKKMSKAAVNKAKNEIPQPKPELKSSPQPPKVVEVKPKVLALPSSTQSSAKSTSLVATQKKVLGLSNWAWVMIGASFGVALRQVNTSPVMIAPEPAPTAKAPLPPPDMEKVFAAIGSAGLAVLCAVIFRKKPKRINQNIGGYEVWSDLIRK